MNYLIKIKKKILYLFGVYYQNINFLMFEKDFTKAIVKCYFDFSLISLALYQHERRKSFLKALLDCNNAEIKCLFHGTQIDPISKIVTSDFKYTRKALFGMGVYFTDKLDYVSYYTGGTNLYERRNNFGKINSVGETISCIATAIYYDIENKKNIYNDDLYVELNYFPTYDEIKKNIKNKWL